VGVGRRRRADSACVLRCGRLGDRRWDGASIGCGSGRGRSWVVEQDALPRKGGGLLRHATAESVISLFKTELYRNPAVLAETAALEGTRRSRGRHLRMGHLVQRRKDSGELDDQTPAEVEAAHYREHPQPNCGMRNPTGRVSVSPARPIHNNHQQRDVDPETRC
jgi:hypothetical protein